MTIPVVVSWSGGKDCAMALSVLLDDPRYEVVGLLTTFTRNFDRVSMHGVRRNLVRAQAQAVGVPLVETWITAGASNDEYEQAMSEGLLNLARDGIVTVAFGDLFLQDIRDYRERLIARNRIKPLFPIWKRDTREVSQQFLRHGYRAKTCCVDTRVIDESFCGRELDRKFFADLPETVDPCGENGEFHTFVFDGPMFRKPLNIRLGQIHRDEPFTFCDIVPTPVSDPDEPASQPA